MSATDTPKTDAAEQVIIQILVKWAKGKIYAEDMTVAVQHELRQLRTLERQNRELAEALQTLLLALETCKPGASVIKAAESKARAALTKAAL